MLIGFIDKEDGRIDVGVPVTGGKLIEHDDRTLGEIVVQQPVTVTDPVDVPPVGRRSVIVPPASRFSQHCLNDLIQAHSIEACDSVGREDAVIEEMAVYVVGERQTVFVVCQETPMQVGWAAAADPTRYVLKQSSMMCSASQLW